MLTVNFIDDIRDFHVKFELRPTGDPYHRLPDDTQEFRLKFMLEELMEYAESVGYQLDATNTGDFVFRKISNEFKAAQALDGLVDLGYVLFGTAYLHRFPFTEAWSRVQEANMMKVKATHVSQSTRGYSADIVKPLGWKAPCLDDLIDPLRSASRQFARIFDKNVYSQLNILIIMDSEESAKRIRWEIDGMFENEHKTQVIVAGQPHNKKYISVVYLCTDEKLWPSNTSWLVHNVMPHVDEDGIMYILDGDDFTEVHLHGNEVRHSNA
jgi:predicted HAD superfamily Cof-like phosphohydrolase